MLLLMAGTTVLMPVTLVLMLMLVLAMLFLTRLCSFLSLVNFWGSVAGKGPPKMHRIPLCRECKGRFDLNISNQRSLYFRSEWYAASVWSFPLAYVVQVSGVCFVCALFSR